jgi:ketosteroid isomerase-like protein
LRHTSLAVSQENVKIARHLMEAFNRRDLEEFLTFMAPTVEFFAPRTAAEVGRGTPYSGHEGARQFFADVESVWGASLQLHPQEFHPEGDHVVAVGTVTGQRDGEHLDTEAAWGWKLREGKMVWGRAYEIPATAFDDVGVSKHDSRTDS